MRLRPGHTRKAFVWAHPEFLVPATPTPPAETVWPTATVETPSPRPAPSIAAFDWHRATLPRQFGASFGDARINAALGGFIVGNGIDTPQWSADGIKWRDLKGPPVWASFRGDGTPHGGFAFGCAERPNPDDDSSCPSAIWRSLDGTRSQRATLGADLATTTLTDLAANDGHFLAVGVTCAPECDLPDLIVLSSTDGLQWRRTAGPTGAEPGGNNEVGLSSVGHRFIMLGGGEADVWTSGDGQTWSPGFSLPDPSGGYIYTAFAGSTYIIVATPDSSDLEQLWTSPDGGAWSAQVMPTAMQATELGVASMGASAIAVGNNDPSMPGIWVWTSTDGTHWVAANSPLGSNEHGDVREAVSDGRHVVILGDAAGPDTYYPVTWTSTISP